MCEIFGKTSGTTKVKELLDVTSEDQFELEWKRLEEIWKGRGSKFIFVVHECQQEKYHEEMHDS